MKLLKRMRKQGAYFLSLTTLLSIFAGMPLMASSTAAEFNYNDALEKSVIFYDANKCGKDVADNNELSWRSACHVNDGKDKGLDLTGGFHDCGDHVKFGITQNYAASVLGWSYLDYREAFEKAGNSDKMYDTLKYVTDYLLKCHPNANTFYYQIGDGNTDHSYWGVPEKQGDRSVQFVINSGTPGSDIAGGASAALSIMYLNSKDKDPEYAEKCLNAAKSLYVLGTSNKGIAPFQSFYESKSYKDDLAWAATWLYRATNESKYLADAEKYIQSPENPSKPAQSDWVMCWDDMNIPTTVELYKITKNEKYKDAVEYNMNYWYNMTPTAGGLKIRNSWGSLRYAAAASAIAMQYYNISGDSKAKDLAMSQINYILGDNPSSMSYVIGFGNKYPSKPHHRAANGYQGFNDNNHMKDAKNVLVGALVGGPGEGDSYSNDPNKYTETEVGIDYNAGLVMALAGIITDGKISEIKPGGTTNPGGETTNPGGETTNPGGETTNPGGETTNPGGETTNPGQTADGVNVSVTTQESGTSIGQVYTITATGSQAIDLSKVTIRQYFSKDGNSTMQLFCDHAAAQLNEAPWYQALTSDVKTTFGKDSNGNYVEITFGNSVVLKLNAGTVTIQTRMANTDWSSISGFKAGNTVVTCK